MDKAKVLKALNLDLEHEMSAMIRYLHHSFIVSGPMRGPLVTLFRNRARDCMNHAIKLGEKISVMGGHPSVKIQEIYEPGDQTIEEMLKENLEVEKSHLQMYEEQLLLVQDNTPLRIMLEQILVEETAHVEELEMYLRDSERAAVKA
jgi:bacterioferritin